MKFLSTTHTPRFNFAVLLVHFADLHVDFVNKFWTRLTMKWPWREHEVARRLHITITFFSCLVVFGVLAFLLASAQVMYTSHRFRFIFLFRSYICIFILCCVRVGFVRYGSLASNFFFCQVNTKWNFPTSRKNIFTSASVCAKQRTQTVLRLTQSAVHDLLLVANWPHWCVIAPEL